KASDDEMFFKLYARLNTQVQVSTNQARTFVLSFDRGDVAWLRGYCHLLTALAEVYLAHESRELFNHAAHLVFARPRTPFDFLQRSGKGPRDYDAAEVVDWITAIHVVRLPVVEPRRVTLALEHLETMIGLSREAWRFYEQETDDDREWIPNPRQESA